MMKKGKQIIVAKYNHLLMAWWVCSRTLVKNRPLQNAVWLNNTTKEVEHEMTTAYIKKKP